MNLPANRTLLTQPRRRGVLAQAEQLAKPAAIALLAVAQATSATGRAAELPAPLAELHAECPATVEDDRHDQRITRCLELYRAGRLPL